jgi:hypothetical protein
MTRMERRGFLKLTGAGSAAAAAAVLPGSGLRAPADERVLRFSAAVSLPRPPLHSHATQVVEGTVDLAKGSGLVTSRVLAGHPKALGMALPDLTRVIRINGTSREGRRLRLQGVIEDRSHLQHGESPQVEIVIDRARGVVQAPFAGRLVEHELT